MKGKKARIVRKPNGSDQSETSTGNSRDDHGWKKVVYRKRHQKQKPADLPANGGVSGKIVPNQSLANGGYNAFRALMVASDESNGVGAARNENPKAEETEKAIESLSEAAAKIDPSHLAAFLDERKGVPELDLWRFYFYLEEAFSEVSFQWLKMFKESPLSDVPLSHIPKPVYETSAIWIKQLQTTTHWKFVTWALNRILTDWAEQQGDAKGAQHTSTKSQVATVVELAIVLRSKPDALTTVLPMLRWRPRYQGEDKLPVIVWMMAQAFQGDLSAGLYSWAHILLPLVGNKKCCSPQSMDLILRFVEIILSNPEARTILVNGVVWEGERLIPPSSFEILVRLTFPASSARVEATKRFEAIYPLLKEVALAPESAAGRNAVNEIFTFSLKLAGEGNPVLAKEATAIAIWSVTENVECFKQWDILYKENLEASVAVLKKLVDEWKDHSLKLSSSPSDTLIVNRTMNSFRLKNEKAITEGGANCSLYKEADKSCKLISGRISRGSGGLKVTPITAVVLAAAVAAAGGFAGAALVLYTQ